MAKAKSRSQRGQVGEVTPTAAAPAGQPSTWTLMIYLAGDNNLSDEMIWALKEIHRVGAPPGVSVTVQFDPVANDRKTRFYAAPAAAAPLDVDGIFPILHDDELPDLDSGDPDAVVEFVRRSIEIAPATYYMLILSGHGAGILGDFLTDTSAGQPAGSLTIPAVGRMFRRLRTRLEETGLGRPGVAIDVLGLDTCVMSMAEICSEVMGETTYLVGSEGFDPNTGWPYYRILEALGKKAALPNPDGLAKLVADEYILYYSDYVDADVSVDLSVCDVSEQAVKRIESAVTGLVDTYLRHHADSLVTNAVVLAHWKAQSYKLEQYTDLVDFCVLLQAECEYLAGVPEGTGAACRQIAECCQTVVAAVIGTADGSAPGAVKYCDYAGVDFQHSQGLSVYFPWSRQQYEEAYRFSRFAARTGWDRFLDAYVDGTQRPMRERRSPIAGKVIDPRDVAIVDHKGTLALNLSHITRPVRPGAIAATERGAYASVPRSTSSLSRANDSSSGINLPSARMNAPSSRMNAPSSRMNAPSSRMNAPSSRMNAPSSRFGQFLDTLMSELPSRMKNAPTEANPVVPFTIADWETLQTFKRAHTGATASAPVTDSTPPAAGRRGARTTSD